MPLFLLSVLLLSAGSEASYPVSTIPPEYLSSSAVMRDHTVRLEVRSPRKAILTVHTAVTILSREDQEEGELLLFYDANRRVTDFEGRLLDRNGEEIRSIDEDDLEDRSATNGYTLYDDSRVKIASLVSDRYPYTVEYSYEIELRGSLNWPAWRDRSDFFPVEHSSFEVLVPDGMPFHYRCSVDSMMPEISASDGNRSYRWSASMLPAIARDAADRDLTDVSALVEIKTDEFEIFEKRGSMKDWRSFGAWYHGLTVGQDKLPAAALQEVASAVSAARNRTDSIAAVYRMMQRRTRYVNIRLGIGGWQPYDATYVHTRGYGDCKALANYTQSLLSAVGIPSRQVLIDSGNDERSTVTDFPSNQFNHVILCVPNGKDSVWLECTDQEHPFGTLNSHTEDRPALLVDTAGGHIVMTPAPSPLRNRHHAAMDVHLSPGGTVSFQLSITLTGNQQLDYRSIAGSASTEKRQEYVISQLELPSVQVLQFRDAGLAERNDTVTVFLAGSAPGAATISSGRMFFRPSLLDRRTTVPDRTEKRLSPYRFPYRYCDTDSIVFRVPDGYTIESMPRDVSVEKPFGSFRSVCTAAGDSALIYVRRTEITQRTVAAKYYEEIRSFFSEMVKTDRAQVVLKKK